MITECFAQANILFGAMGAAIGFVFYKGYQAFQDINVIIKAQNIEINDLKEYNNKQSKQITKLKIEYIHSLHKLYDTVARQADKTEYVNDKIENILDLLGFSDNDNESEGPISTDCTSSCYVQEILDG